jgi:hypothetical protein
MPWGAAHRRDEDHMVLVADEEERRPAHLAALCADRLEHSDLLADADAQPAAPEWEQDAVDAHRDVHVEPRAGFRLDQALKAALDRIQLAPPRRSGGHARTLPDCR